MQQKTYLIRFKPGGITVRTLSTDSILDAASLAGIEMVSACGTGKCGKCTVTVKEGKVECRGRSSGDSFPACATFPLSDLVVEIPQKRAAGKHQILDDAEPTEKVPLIPADAGVALDVGTSTVVGHLLDLRTGKTVACASAVNKQSKYGADVVSRMDYAKKRGIEKLNNALIETVNGLLEELCTDRGNPDIKSIAAAGNPTVTCLLMKKNPGIVRKDPQSPEFREPARACAKELGIKASGDVYALPGVSGYVGGDIVADVIASGMDEQSAECMLVDLGTNGEIVLGCSEYLLACSTSAGPAFEGASVSCGMCASSGAIEKVNIKKDLAVEYATIHDARPCGICGSGLIDVVADLHVRGLVDHKGKFTGEREGLVRKGASGLEFVLAPKEETATGCDITVNESDIRNLIQSKAALYAGTTTLANTAGGFREMEKFYIAGGFGYRLDYEKAVVLGLLPDIPREKYCFIGNGSVKGASIALTQEGKTEAERIAKKTTYIDLGKNREFAREYIAALFIPHGDASRFPSVEEP